MEQKSDYLGTEKVRKLIFKFAVPCVISLVVAALYNIVDQIFIGWSDAGETGNAATNIVYPFTVFALGFALLFGDGGCSNFSIYLGKKDQNKANNCIGLSLLLLIILSIIITSIAFIFKDNILKIFGANPDEVECYEYANTYYTIISIGFPFYIIGQGLNGAIRADGSPKYAMICTLAGAIFNIIFDPIFIFVFDLDVKGAAIATILGQVLTFIISVIYLFKAKNFKLNKDAFKIDIKIIGKIFAVGLASLIVQLSIVVIATINNNLFSKYGYETKASTGEYFGAITPLAVVGIVLKIFGIVVSIAIGIGLGGQPIIGYNTGTKNMKRIKECCRWITVMTFIVGFIALILFETIPNVLISLFGVNKSIEYNEYASLCMRIYLCCIPFTCYIKSTAIMLQSMGNSLKSTLTALMRDVITFVPASVILAVTSHNIVTMLWAAPIADTISVVVAFFFLHTEIKKQDAIIKQDELLPEE